MALDLDKAMAEAVKILGKDAKIPKKSLPDVKKRHEERQKVQKTWLAAKDVLEKHLVEMQDAISKYKDGLSRAEDELTESDFGLDPKKPDDKKKIDQAHKIFEAELGPAIASTDSDIKALKEVDKHLVNVRNYKPSA